jgi:uncharacterized protein
MANLKKIHWIIIIGFFLSVIFLKAWQFYWPKMDVILKDIDLHVLVAKDSEHMYRGLGGRENLGEYDGMLFIYPDKNTYGIVMRDMMFPIDIVWLDTGEVVDIAPNVSIEPGVIEEDLKVYYPRKKANLILELPAGWVEEKGLKIGDMMYKD